MLPSDALLRRKLTHIWSLAIGRFPGVLRQRAKARDGVTEIARCFLSAAGMTVPGELVRACACRAEAGLGTGARQGRLRRDAVPWDLPAGRPCAPARVDL